MKLIEIVDEAVQSTAGDDDTVNHYWCCNPELSVCGIKLEGASWEDPLDEEPEPDDCVVCVDLYDPIEGCPVCRYEER